MRSMITILALTVAATLAACGGAKTGDGSDHAGMGHNAGSANTSAMDHSQMDHSKMDGPMASSPGAETAPYDLQFIDTMTAHHRGAVDMAKKIDGRASHAELNLMTANVIADQEKEIAEMAKWREQRFSGKAMAVNMQMPGMSDSMKDMDMKKLGELSGNDLDLEFIRQMISHHKGAVVMASEALQKSQNEDIRKMAANVIKAQKAEIAQMQGWQTAWAK